jgi:hypothetical protein
VLNREQCVIQDESTRFCHNSWPQSPPVSFFFIYLMHDADRWCECSGSLVRVMLCILFRGIGYIIPNCVSLRGTVHWLCLNGSSNACLKRRIEEIKPRHFTEPGLRFSNSLNLLYCSPSFSLLMCASSLSKLAIIGLPS